MRKIFLLFAMAAFAVSCSSDSDSGSSSVLLSKVSVTNAGDITTYDFTYDDSKRISQIIKNAGTETYVHTLSYNSDNQLSSIVTTGDDTGVTLLTYDSNKRLSSYAVDGEPAIGVIYSDGTYTVLPFQYTLNSRKDFNTIISGELFTFNYDTSKKGIFNNAKGDYAVLALFSETDFLIFGGKKPISSISASSSVNNYAMVNTYDEDNYITDTSISLGGSPIETVHFDYTE
jgi:hypothetical protein